MLDGERLDVKAHNSVGVLAYLVIFDDNVHVVVEDKGLGALHVT